MAQPPSPVDRLSAHAASPATADRTRSRPSRRDRSRCTRPDRRLPAAAGLPSASARTRCQQPLSEPASTRATQMGPAAAPRAPEGNLATSMLKILRPGRAPEVPARRRSRSAAPPTTTSSSPTCWPRATTRRWSPAPGGTEIRRQPQHQRHVRQRPARRLRECCATATSSRSATSTSSSAAAPWPAATSPTSPPAPAASTSTASRGPSRATRRCSTTSRWRPARAR